MPWTIEFARSVEKDLARLGSTDRKRVLAFLNDRVATHADPKAIAQPLHGPRYAGAWRFRVGDHRIVAEFIDARLVVMVIEIGHRSNVYR